MTELLAIAGVSVGLVLVGMGFSQAKMLIRQR